MRFWPTLFQPHSSKYAGEVCCGVQVHVLDREIFRPVRTALHLLSTVHALYPEKLAWNPHFDRLVGTDRVREQISEGKPVEEIIASWKTEEARFENLRQKYLLY